VKGLPRRANTQHCDARTMRKGIKRLALPVVRVEPEEFERHQSGTGPLSPHRLSSQKVVRGHWRSGFSKGGQAIQRPGGIRGVCD
jgi:hypothetical protein